MVLSLLVLSWAGVSAQPCVMAMESSQDSRAVAAHDHDMHGSHDSDRHAMQFCDHCPSEASALSNLCIDGMNADCGGGVEYSAESRKVEFKPKSADAGASITGPPALRITSPVNSNCAWQDPGLLKRQTAPALSIRNCVFLK